MPSCKSKLRSLSGVGLERVMTTVLVGGWPRVSLDFVSRQRLDSVES
jgi:hypothetical protein